MLSKNKIKIAISQLEFAGNEHDTAEKPDAKAFTTSARRHSIAASGAELILNYLVECFY